MTVYRMASERARRSCSLPRSRPNRFIRSSDGSNRSPRNFDNEKKIGPHATLPKANHHHNQRGYSLDRKKETKDTVEIEMDPIILDRTPILCNKYVVGRNYGFVGTIPGKGKSIPVFLV